MNLWSLVTRLFKPGTKPAANRAPRFQDALVSEAIAQAALNIRETSRNKGPGIEKFWTATSYGTSGYRNRESWCAAFMAWIVRSAAIKHFGESPPFRFPRSAAVNDWPVWADSQPVWQALNPLKTKVKAGDIICWDFNGRDNSGGTHIGLAVSDERPDGRYDTVEGNTNADGSRDGNGVYHRTTRSRNGAFSVLRYIG